MSTKAVRDPLKAILKATKAHIDSQNWESAKSESLGALSLDPQNYLGNVFLGVSLYNQESFGESEAAYREAITAEAAERERKGKKNENPLAWQGLVSLYDAQRKVGEYIDSALKLAVIYRDMDDRTKCQTVIDKLVPSVKEHGSKEQYKRALRILLPGSPVFDYLEGLIPHPSQTYDKIIQIVEGEEKEKINKEIAKRRFMLGAYLDKVSLEVTREVLEASPLEGLYQELLNWSDNEEVRREVDRKLLQHAYDKLLVLPKEQKGGQRGKVWKWAEGLVILKHPFELAWNIIIEWKDCESIGEHDVNVLREYIGFFPKSGRAKVLQSYLNSEISPFPRPEKVEGANSNEPANPDHSGPSETASPDELVDAMIDGLKESPESILCHRILGEYYTLLEEFEGAVEIARSGTAFLTVEASRTGIGFQRNSEAFAVILATALIHYQTPRHHDEAKALLEGVLERNREYGSALVGLGLILEEQQDYAGAADLLEKALTLDSNDVKIISEAAWCNVLQGKYDEGRSQLENCLPLVTGTDPRSRDLKAQVLWRIGTALWNSDEQGRADRKGPHSYFISALQSNQNFAPAYTSLGIFYQDIAGDSARADKCFQKAFEISAGEVEAAERLARNFAESREWELVEIIARRVADADKKRSMPGKGVSWPQRAIGVVELNAQNFNLAIQAFQAALRASPGDYHSWVGLGEAYASSGRWVAALKVFLQAEKLDNTSWFPKYMLANVRREIGEYEDACSGYRSVLELRPKEFGVLVALSETLLAAAWHYIETGFFGRAADSAEESLKVTQVIVKEKPDAFNLWKTVGDCCLVFSWIQSYADRITQGLVQILKEDVDLKELEILVEVDGVDSQALVNDEAAGLTTCLKLAILAYKRGIHASADDRHAHAVAWFNLGCAEYRAYITLPDRPSKYRMAAITCFKRTIKLEPGNHEFWNALGVATGELNVKVAQHALVRALYINEKNARVWTNLATLYLIQNDMQLANEVFSRAQSADPEYALAWVGQGFVAALMDIAGESQELFEHAFEIADSSSTLVKRQFSTTAFDGILQMKSESARVSLIGPIFALQKLEQEIPDDLIALRLSALFAERVGDFASASGKLEVICGKVEQRYEETELEDDLIQYAQAKADLARVMLSQKEYEAAVESATLALDLSGDIGRLDACRLSAHLTAGLANYYLGVMSESLEMFKAALSESGENPDVVCLVCQVLWAKGGDDERDVAREQLFTCIENNPDHLQSMMLLGAIGILDNSEDILEAVMDDLRAVRGREGLDKASKQKVDRLLSRIAQLQVGEDATAAAATAVFIQPSLSSAWSNLSELAGGNKHATEMALNVALESKTMDPEELCHAYSQQGVIACDQNAIMVAPWRAGGWNGLAEDVRAAAL